MEGIKVGIHNEWKIVVRDAKTGEVKKEGKGQNILLNQWWTIYLSTSNDTCLRYIHFGSGTAEPVATNTKLTSPIGSKDSRTASTSVLDFSEWESEGIISVKRTARLEANEYIGQTISEVGFAYGLATTGNLATHSLITDMNGNPLSIEKHADEVIDIFGTVFFKLGTKFDSGRLGFICDRPSFNALTRMFMTLEPFSIPSSNNKVAIPGTSIFWVRDAAYVSTPNDYPGAIPLGNVSHSFNVPNKTYKYTFSDFTVSNANVIGGIGSLIFSQFQMRVPCTGFSQPVIEKEVVGTGNGVTKDFQTKFGMIRNNGTFKAYVNDIEVSATADYDQPYPNTNIAHHINILPGSTYYPYAINMVTDNILVFENPLSEYGINTIRCRQTTVYTSDDGEVWTQAAQRTSSSINDLTIPAEHSSKRYWKCIPFSGTNLTVENINSTAFASAKNVHLAEALPEGATIAVTYQPDVIAKDDQHTIKNLSITFSFNEYTP